MTDDVMKKVESLLFDEDEQEVEEEIREVKEAKEAKETAKEAKETKEEKREPLREVRPKAKPEAQDCIEISFDGYAVVSGAKIKTLPGSEIEVNGLRLVFKDSKVMIFV